MNNVLVNFYHSKSGGGKVILDNYLNELVKKRDENFYYVLVNDINLYKEKHSLNVKIITLPFVFRHELMFLFLYYIYFPYLIYKHRVHLILNFGDLLYPYSIKQIYFFDWAYVAYSGKKLWSKMSLIFLSIRRIKSFLIKIHAKNASIVICQTEFMASELSEKLGVLKEKIVVINTPIAIKKSLNQFIYVKKNYNISTQKLRLFYPASYATHKNFFFIIDLAKLIEKKKLNIEFVITIDPLISNDFWTLVKKYNIECIKNLGTLNHEQVINTYLKSDVLFFPSLLESYGFPLVEAMTIGIPILVSNLPYAKSICRDSAFYFDPYDCESALFSIEKFIEKENVNDNIQKGINYSSEILNWVDFHNKILSIISHI